MTENMNDIEARIEDNAVNVYQNDMADEFPVLKAFQQYIDAEQAKARKRMLLLCVFFSFILVVVIAVFVSLLLASSSRNQNLNDRLVEYAMKDRERAAPVVSQPVQSQNDAVLQALTGQFEALQKSIAEDRSRAEKQKLDSETEKARRTTAEMLEIARLKALLAAEKEKAAAEREKQRQSELEAYRRTHYPELYNPKPRKASSSERTSRDAEDLLTEEEKEADREIEAILKDVKAIDYFSEDSEDGKNPHSVRRSTSTRAQKKDAAPAEDDVKVPDGIKDSSGTIWGIPEE